MKNAIARSLAIAAAASAVFAAGWASTPPVRADPRFARSATASGPEERFDHLVRDDFFAGMRGDNAALDRGMKRCEEVLARNPRHADALVWHGGGLLTRASQAYARGDSRRGDQLWRRGIEEMDRAVAAEPENIGVKIGRAATLIGLAQAGWDPSDVDSRRLLESALRDYELIHRRQKPNFARLSTHSRGELLFGLASGWSILGDHERARTYLSLIARHCAGTAYEREARTWLARKPSPVIDHECIGCHAAPR